LWGADYFNKERPVDDDQQSSKTHGKMVAQRNLNVRGEILRKTEKRASMKAGGLESLTHGSRLQVENINIAKNEISPSLGN